MQRTQLLCAHATYQQHIGWVCAARFADALARTKTPCAHTREQNAMMMHMMHVRRAALRCTTLITGTGSNAG